MIKIKSENLNLKLSVLAFAKWSTLIWIMCILNPFHQPGKMFCKLIILVLFIVSGNQTLLAQRFNFDHYDIEDGLIQSQARAFAQSPSHHVWVATQGGVSRFDGSLFTSLT